MSESQKTIHQLRRAKSGLLTNLLEPSTSGRNSLIEFWSKSGTHPSMPGLQFPSGTEDNFFCPRDPLALRLPNDYVDEKVIIPKRTCTEEHPQGISNPDAEPDVWSVTAINDRGCSDHLRESIRGLSQRARVETFSDVSEHVAAPRYDDNTKSIFVECAPMAEPMKTDQPEMVSLQIETQLNVSDWSEKLSNDCTTASANVEGNEHINQLSERLRDALTRCQGPYPGNPSETNSENSWEHFQICRNFKSYYEVYVEIRLIETYIHKTRRRSLFLASKWYAEWRAQSDHLPGHVMTCDKKMCFVLMDMAIRDRVKRLLNRGVPRYTHEIHTGGKFLEYANGDCHHFYTLDHHRKRTRLPITFLDHCRINIFDWYLNRLTRFKLNHHAFLSFLTLQSAGDELSDVSENISTFI
jgi:hypothetical protein